ncbi:MAG TPA: pyruvate kinase [Gemmatimonadaceae bacterium]|nr:pyruvate kinase [Gemmatimonadaceae bacterium]
MSRTKIVGTLGPASSSAEMIRELIEAGLNVARINFSHGTPEEHAATIACVRRVAATLGRPVAVLGDLQGPRIRVGELTDRVTLEQGEDVIFAPEGSERRGEIPVTYDALANDVRVGDRILVDDGLLELVVMDIEGSRVRARVVHGGPVSSHKGINLPGVLVSAPSLTEKDRADIAFAVKHGLDYLALSFVRRADDIAELRSLIPRGMWIVAKIEKDTALEDIGAIVESADAVMIARGDLGVELPFEEVPIAQKRIIGVANELGRPVITATQMLESMVTRPRPTRAEASDVANAILDGTDAVMLSAETAMGAYPVLAVQAMTRIITEIERHPRSLRRVRTDVHASDGRVPTEDAIAAATVAAVRSIGAPVVVVFTKSGFTARIVAAHRPDVPILALTDVERTYRQLALVWGVIPELVPSAANYDEMFVHARAAIQRAGLAGAGDRVLVTAGVPFDVPGTTNLLKVEIV